MNRMYLHWHYEKVIITKEVNEHWQAVFYLRKHYVLQTF